MILSSEVILIGTILVLGSIAGLSAVQSAVTHELNDCARAYDSYSGYDDDRDIYAISQSDSVPEIAGDYR